MAPKLQTPIAEFNGVSFRYGTGQDVLKDIQFTLDPGSFHFMTGESGAGKTSLLSLLYSSTRDSKSQPKQLIANDNASEPL